MRSMTDEEQEAWLKDIYPTVSTILAALYCSGMAEEGNERFMQVTAIRLTSVIDYLLRQRSE